MRIRGPAGTPSACERDQGAVLVFASLLLVALFGVTALVVDVGNMYWVRRTLQNAADAGALAAASDVTDQDAARATAIEYADANSPDGSNVLSPDDVRFGFWDKATRTFYPGGFPVNAVEVITRRSKAGGNPVQHKFAQILGISESDVSARAVAMLSSAVVDFENLQPGDQPDQIRSGEGISGDAISGFVRISGDGHGPMIFDAACAGGPASNCTGGDTDLYQPTQGNVLIISEDGDSSDPDDDGRGGIIEFDFSSFGGGFVSVGSLVLIDAEEGGTVTLYRDGEIIDQTFLGGVSDGEMEYRFVSEVSGVDFMRIELGGSGAIDDIGYQFAVSLVG